MVPPAQREALLLAAGAASEPASGGGGGGGPGAPPLQLKVRLFFGEGRVGGQNGFERTGFFFQPPSTSPEFCRGCARVHTAAGRGRKNFAKKKINPESDMQLIAGEAARLRSWAPPPAIAAGVPGLIDGLYDRLEATHGVRLSFVACLFACLVRLDGGHAPSMPLPICFAKKARRWSATCSASSLPRHPT